MADVRGQLVARIRDRIATARGIAHAEIARAQQRLAAAERELDRASGLAVGFRSRSKQQLDDRLAAAATRAARNQEGLYAAASQIGWQAASATYQEDRAAPLVRVGRVRLEQDEPPALVPLLDRGHIQITGGGPTPKERLNQVNQLLTTLLATSLDAVPPGSLKIFGYDPGHLGSRFSLFAPLLSGGLLTFYGPRELGGMLDTLVDEVHRISHRVLAGEYVSLRELAEAGRGRPEPWRVAVLLGDGTAPSAHDQAQVRRLLRTGVNCGVHVIANGFPFGASHDDIGGDVTTINLCPDFRLHVGGYANLEVLRDPPRPSSEVTELAKRVAKKASAEPPALELSRLLPPAEEYWRQSSAEHLATPIGQDQSGREVRLYLADQPPHALIGGPTGSGKTNFIYAWLAGLATRYSPDELALYLLDFKEGVSFARFTSSDRSPGWLPHVRLVGLNVNTDREFGLALLRFLSDQLRIRAEAAKTCGVTKLAELRAEQPTRSWPRIVAIIDEFQVLLGGRDSITQQAVSMLEDLARRGRSQGIHLVLASQDVTGIEALWGRSSLLAQLTLRIALPKARRILTDTNAAANEIPRYHAVVNPDSGVPEANQIVRIPDAGKRADWNELLTDFATRYQLHDSSRVGPRVFDGDAVPLLQKAPDYLALRPAPGVFIGEPGGPWGGRPHIPVAMVGETLDVTARSATIRFGRAPGRNLAVLGTSSELARSVLDAAALSLARQYHPGEVRFSVACLDPEQPPDEWFALRDLLPTDTRWYTGQTVLELLDEVTGQLDVPHQPPHFIFLHAVDAAAGQLGTRRPGGSGHELLRRLLQQGPERRTHLLGWWRTIARLRDDLGGLAARFDSIGAWVALDVHGSELAPLTPGGAPTWYPRPRRALFFDRTVHRSGEVIIPFREAQ